MVWRYLPILGWLPRTAFDLESDWVAVTGQRSQMASLINAVFILLTILVLASLFEKLPGATPGAVVIDAMVGLITLSAFQHPRLLCRASAMAQEHALAR